ncbi:Goodbye domain-containing protein [Fusarium falciforme]|uniref:Goodbye domain-containing protein n=1 Tax=Fusarium falciforme TaxID=195108 RepID=UPI002301199E|nr:Goodbye domain-containing protein [Fusarium falciforme]WAO96658.1 Goodbye domain-containing protein [Fusarium falciforme]
MSSSSAIDPAMDSAWRTDIGTLWTAAVAKHNQKVGIKFKLDQSKAMNTPWNSTTMQATLNRLTAEFEKERDSLGHFSDRIKGPLQVTLKVAKGAAEVILRTASTIGAIAGSVFAPAPIIAEALVFVLSATQKVSGQLDEIKKFFEVTANFFRRLSVLEGRLPDGPQFGQQLVDVFDRLLGFIVDAQIFVGRGKFMNFFKELAKPSTPLSDAHALFQEQLTRLDQAALYCTLGISVDINKNVADLRASVDLVIDDTHHIVGQIDGLGTNIVDLQLQIGSFRRDFSTFSHEIRHKPKTEDASKQIADAVTVDHASYQSNVLRTLRASFNIGDTEGIHQRRLTRMLSSRLPGTCEWIHHHQAYHTLLDGTSQFLLLQGGRHTGRSMLSSFIFEHLKTSKQQLPINKSGTQTEAAGISIVEQDAAYRKWAMDHCLGQKSRGESTNPTWDDHFEARFKPSEGNSHEPWLFLILDDVDIAESKHDLLEFQTSIENRKLRISLVLTTSSNMEMDIPEESKIILGAGNTNAENHDLRTFTKHLAMNLSPLNDLAPETRESLVNGVCEKATTYLYVDYALRRFNVLGGSDLSPLNTLKTSHVEIYGDLFHECIDHRNEQEQTQLHCLFTWLALCNDQPLCIGTAKVLLKLVSQWNITTAAEEGSEGKGEAKSRDGVGLAAGNRLQVELAGNLSLLLSRAAPMSRHGQNGGQAGDDDLIQFRHPALQAYWPTTTWATLPANVLMFKMLSHVLTEKTDVGEQKDKNHEQLVYQAATLWFKFLRAASSQYLHVDSTMDSHQMRPETAPPGSIMAMTPPRSIMAMTPPRSIMELATSRRAIAPICRSQKTMIRTSVADHISPPPKDSRMRSQRAPVSEHEASGPQLVTFPRPEVSINEKSQPAAIVAKTVVRGMAHVFSNENGALKVLEVNVPEVDWGKCQSLLGTNFDEISATLRILSYWLRLVDGSDLTGLSEGPRDWLNAIKPERDDPEPHCNILEQLAARHSDNWGAAQFPSSAYNSFRFAHQALRDRDTYMSQGWEPYPQHSEPEARTEAILKVGEGLRARLIGRDDESERLKAATASVAIAMALRYDGLYEPALAEALNAAEIIEGQDEHGRAVFNAFENAYDGAMRARDDESDTTPKTSIGDYEERLQQLMGSGNSFALGSKEAKLRFDVYNRIGRICYGMSEDKTDLAVEAGANSIPEKELEKKGYLEAARLAFVTALGTKEEGRNMIRTYWLKAKVEALLRDDKRALESVERAVETANKSEAESTTVFFDELVHELSKGHNGPENVLQLLDLVGHAQLVKGFMAETHRRIHKAAKKRGKPAAEKVKKTYAEAVNRLIEGENSSAQMLSIWWADFVRFVWAGFQADAADEAEEILRRALRVKVAGSVDTTIRIGWRLADMFLEQFLSSAKEKQESVDLKDNLAKKQAALDKMEDLMSQLQGLQADFEPYQSQISIPLSIMRRKLSPALSFFEGADQTFRGCVTTLTDEHQDNDAPSFQVLAKVLCLVPGLKKHAEIAASCQFYVIDDQLFTGETQSPVTCSYCEKQIGGDAEAEAVYLCCYCTNTFACKSCYDNKESSRSSKTTGDEIDDVVLQPACRPEHMYVSARGDDWGGTRDGKMVIKGEQERELSFQEWLDEVKREWEVAWQKSWGEPAL